MQLQTTAKPSSPEAARPEAPSAAQLRSIMQAAVLAPSPDNHHLFRLQPSPAGLRLWATPALLELHERQRKVLNFLSLGAVLVNIRLRAADLGLATSVSWLPRGDPGLLAEVGFRSGAQPSALAAELEHRHTNRRLSFRGPKLDSARQRQLVSLAETDGARLDWLDEGPRRRAALRLVWQAESERFLCRHLHALTFAALRTDVGWSAGCDEGLPPGALEVEAPFRRAFIALGRWGVMRAAQVVLGHRMLGARAALLPCALAPHLAVLSLPEPTDDGQAVQCGAALQRIWLQATAWGLSLQPFPASAVLALEPSEPDAEAARPSVRSALRSGWARLLPERTPLMVFRLGHAAAPTCVAGRKALSEYLAPEEADA